MKLVEVHEVKQREIRRRFSLPKDTGEVEVDEFFRPYQQTSQGRVMYPLKRTALIANGFHTHGGTKNNR